MTKRRTSRPRQRRGRSFVALALVAFVLVASLVVWRRSVGVAESRTLEALRREQAQLEARKAQLERDIRDLSSRAVLAPIAERVLGMHVARDDEQVFLIRESLAPITPSSEPDE